MLSLGILISDLVVTNLFMHSLPTLLCRTIFTPKAFLHDIPYSRKFSEINIFGNYNEHRISEIKFRNLVYLLQILPHYNYMVNYFSAGFSEIKFRKVNEISEISENIYLQKFPAIWYCVAPNFCGLKFS